MAERGYRLDGVCLDRAGGGPFAPPGVEARFLPGAVALVRGPTGAGKTSLLGLLGGLLRPTAGEVRYDGEPVSRWTAAHRDRWRRRVGIALQRPLLLDGMTALENVMVARIPLARHVAGARGEAAKALAATGVESLAGRKVEDLSGGERQRVALARALVGSRDVLLLDEPTAHQDDEGCLRVVEVVAAARDRGALVVVASHDPRLLGAGVADEVWTLDGGRLLGGGR